MTRWPFLILGLPAVLAVAAPAPARPPANANPALHAWFESLREPGTNLGCCSESDCHVMASEDVKQTRDGYQIRVRDLWIAVPHDKILQHQWNPTGGTVACYGPGRDAATQAQIMVYCFVRGTET